VSSYRTQYYIITNYNEKMEMDRHTPRKGDGSIQKQALDWNPQTAGRGGRTKQTWKRTVLEAAEKCGKTWREVKRMAGNKQSQMEVIQKWPVFQMEGKDILQVLLWVTCSEL
jgi:hypothetical protein